MNYCRDLDARRSSMTVGTQAKVTYGWDDADNLKTIGGSPSVSIYYDNADRRQTVVTNGMAINYVYDPDSNVTSINYCKGTSCTGSNSIGTLSYTYEKLRDKRITVSGSLARTTLPANLPSDIPPVGLQC